MNFDGKFYPKFTVEWMRVISWRKYQLSNIVVSKLIIDQGLRYTFQLTINSWFLEINHLEIFNIIVSIYKIFSISLRRWFLETAELYDSFVMGTTSGECVNVINFLRVLGYGIFRKSTKSTPKS